MKHTVSVVFGRLNTTTGKKLDTNTFVALLLVQKWPTLLRKIAFVVPANLLTRN